MAFPHFIPDPVTSKVITLTSWKWSWGVTLTLETTGAIKGWCRVGAAVTELGEASGNEGTGLVTVSPMTTRYLEGNLKPRVKFKHSQLVAIVNTTQTLLNGGGGGGGGRGGQGTVEPPIEDTLRRGQPLNKGQVVCAFVTSEKRTTSELKHPKKGTTSLQGPIVLCREAPLMKALPRENNEAPPPPDMWPWDTGQSC